MIAELGHFALVLALALALVQGVLPVWGAQRGNAGWMALAVPAARGQFALLLKKVAEDKGVKFAFNTTVDNAGTVMVIFSATAFTVVFPINNFQPPFEVAVLIVALIALLELLKATRYSRLSASSFFEIASK